MQRRARYAWVRSEARRAAGGTALDIAIIFGPSLEYLTDGSITKLWVLDVTQAEI